MSIILSETISLTDLITIIIFNGKQRDVIIVYANIMRRLYVAVEQRHCSPASSHVILKKKEDILMYLKIWLDKGKDASAHEI